MEMLTTTMKEAIKDRLDNITRIARDYKCIMDHDYQFIDGYEENTFYFKFNKAIKTELLKIENILDDFNNTRNYVEIGLDFIDWADDYFQDNFNKVIDRDEAFAIFSLSLPKGYAFKMRNFINKLQLWCKIRGYEYNPKDIMKYKSIAERNHNEIWFTKNKSIGETKGYGFYIGKEEEITNQ